jgi:hypothetical protein
LDPNLSTCLQNALQCLKESQKEKNKAKAELMALTITAAKLQAELQQNVKVMEDVGPRVILCCIFANTFFESFGMKLGFRSMVWSQDHDSGKCSNVSFLKTNLYL